MNLSNVFMEIFFRLLNFGILLAGLRYLYLKYIVTAAHTDIEEDEKKVAIMAQQKDAYYQQEQVMLQNIEHQRQLIAHLTQKLNAWRIAAEDAERAQYEAHQQLEVGLRKKSAEQSERIMQHMLDRQVLPRAINELKDNLLAHFQSDKRGAAYIAVVIDHIKKDH